MANPRETIRQATFVGDGEVKWNHDEGIFIYNDEEEIGDDFNGHNGRGGAWERHVTNWDELEDGQRSEERGVVVAGVLAMTEELVTNNY